MSDEWDLIGTAEQGPVRTHGEARCRGRACCVHAPSGHHMRDWPLSFDMGRLAMGERECEHGYKHPDPDAVAYIRTLLPEGEGLWWTVHTCCGCCKPPEVDREVEQIPR